MMVEDFPGKLTHNHTDSLNFVIFKLMRFVLAVLFGTMQASVGITSVHEYQPRDHTGCANA